VTDVPIEPEGHRAQEFSPALEAVAQRREELRDALGQAERSISRPAPGRLDAWTGDVEKSLLRLQEAFEQHILVTEQPSGLYEDLLHRAPRLAGKVDRLRAEHGTITERTGSTMERLRSGQAGSDAWPVETARDDVQRLLGSIVRHRQVGADLIYEAYFIDIGGME
jgi:hemerythrin HHE cation binding domain-containing protein